MNTDGNTARPKTQHVEKDRSVKNVRLSEMNSYVYEVLKLGRLHLWPISLLAILTGAASHTNLNSSILIQALPLSFLISYISFAPNDYFDFEIDRENSRKEAIGFKISNKDLAKAVFFAAAASSLVAAYLLSSLARISILGVLLSSIVYSVPPLRFKGRAPLDSFCNILGVFFIFSLGVGISGGAISDIIPGAYWFSVIIGGGAHTILAIPDMESDRGDDLRTMPMLLGPRNTVMLIQAFMVFATVFENFSALTTTFLVASTAGLTYFWKERTEGEIFKYIVFCVAISTIYLLIYAITRGVT